MKGKSNYIVFALLFLLVSACTKTFTSEKEMMTYLQDESNGFMQHKTINGVNYTLMYKPTDLLVKQELPENGVTKAQIKELRDRYNKYMYFVLSMSKDGRELLNSKTGDRADFSQMVNQLVFNMDKKIHLFNESKDTIEVLDYIYPRNYGMTPSTSFLFVFPKEKVDLQDNIFFSIEDIGFYTGEVKFKIESKKITEQPKLIFD